MYDNERIPSCQRCLVASKWVEMGSCLDDGDRDTVEGLYGREVGAGLQACLIVKRHLGGQWS